MFPNNALAGLVSASQNPNPKAKANDFHPFVPQQAINRAIGEFANTPIPQFIYYDQMGNPLAFIYADRAVDPSGNLMFSMAPTSAQAEFVASRTSKQVQQVKDEVRNGYLPPITIVDPQGNILGFISSSSEIADRFANQMGRSVLICGVSPAGVAICERDIATARGM